MVSIQKRTIFEAFPGKFRVCFSGGADIGAASSGGRR